MDEPGLPDLDRRDFARCSRCGLCLAVCPTYQERRLEGYGPRGRLALLAAAFQQKDLKIEAEPYLDSCFRCGLCETVCPTAVPYGRLYRWYRASRRRRAVSSWNAELDRLLARPTAEPGSLYLFAALAAELGLPAAHRLAARATPLVRGAGQNRVAPRRPRDGRRALLIAGPLVRRQMPWLSRLASAALSARGYELASQPIDLGGGSDLLEHGLWLPYRAQAKALAAAIEGAEPVDVVATIDPPIQATLAGWPSFGVGSVRPPVRQLWELLEAPGTKARRGSAVDRTPSTLAADAFLGALAGPAAIELPRDLIAAGARPVLEASVLDLLEPAVARKEAWLGSRGIWRLVTADPLTLIRHPTAVHYLELLVGVP